MTGLSNQALSVAPSRPLLTLFEARPIGIERRSGLRVNIRSAGEILPFKAVRVTVTIDCQYLKGSLESESLEQKGTKCARGLVRIMKNPFGGSWKISEQR
jgi:hypothetical protein